MTRKTFNSSLTTAYFIGLVTAVSSVQATPTEHSICVRNAIAQYNDSKAVSLVCLDELEADINEGIEVELPLPPAVIQSRAEQCQALEMTKEQRQVAITACHQVNPLQGNAVPPGGKQERAATSDSSDSPARRAASGLNPW
jgi:hypothetical protein